MRLNRFSLCYCLSIIENNTKNVKISMNRKISVHTRNTNFTKYLKFRPQEMKHFKPFTTAPALKKYELFSTVENDDFMSYFLDFINTLTASGRYADLPEVMDWFNRLLVYNLTKGDKQGGLSVVTAYKQMIEPEQLTEDNLRTASMVGWCVEMLHAFFYIIADTVDNLETRHGAPCWFRASGAGLNVFNDGILMENGNYDILKTCLSDHPSYIPIIELFHDVTMKASMGQSIESFILQNKRPNLDMFTMDRYNTLVKYKTAYYIFQLPVMLAMLLAGKHNEKLQSEVQKILLEIGYFYQVRKDYENCFGNNTERDDIAKGKCTWLAVLALQRSSLNQRRLMEEYYGREDPKAVAVIKTLYETLELPRLYPIYRRENFNLINSYIEGSSKELPQDLLFRYIEKLRKDEI